MNSFFKNTRKLSMTLSALLLAITLAAGSFAYYTNGLPTLAVEDESDTGITVDNDADVELEADDTESSTNPLSLTPMSVQPVSASMPSQLRGAYLVPGSDFVKQKDSGANAIYSEIDKAVKDVVDAGLNAVVIDTVYGDKVIYKTSGAKMLLPDADIMEYLVNKCRDEGLFTIAIFDASHYAAGGDMDKLSENANEFASKYRIDSVLIDGYIIENPVINYNSYLKQGGSIGLENYKLQASATIVRIVASAVHAASPDMAAGLLADAVWANKSDNGQGSATNAKFTALISGNADTKAYVERHFVDFVAVKAYSLATDANEPFGEIVSWWNNVAEQGEVPMYVVHASDKIGTPGWTPDQLTQQTASISHYGAYSGSIFNSLAKAPAKKTAAAKADEPAGYVIKPASSNNQQQQVTPVSSNTQATAAPVNTNTAPALSANAALIKEISPTGVIVASSGDKVKVTATAYRGASLSATINGQSVKLTPGEATGDGYALFTGTYSVPESDVYYDYDEEEDEYLDIDMDFDTQMLGGLSVHASYGGREETMDGVYMATSSKKVPVQITADQAKTYPADTKNNVPIPTMYPLPKGAIDYAVGKEFSYTSAKKIEYTYIVLESGVRVETKDIKEISKGPSNNNEISGMTVTATSGKYTYVTLKTDQKVTYSFAYKGDSVQITFNNTTSVPSSKNLNSNPLFTKASWSGGNKLTLTLAKANCFMGYKGYFDKEGNLVFRFNNPPPSIETAKIAIDPGHGGKDTGALGSNKEYPEKVITRLISEKVAEELESRGAEVYLMETEGVELLDRVQMAEKWGADMLISIHCNSSTNTNAAGTEVFYFYPFSRQFAINSSSGVSQSFATTNRGAKLSYYTMTLSSQMASVLVETGFMSNKTEYSKLLKSSSQKKIATGLADAVESAIKSVQTGVDATGTESSGSKVSTAADDDSDDSRSTGGGKITDLYFDTEAVSVEVGGTAKLKPFYEPEDADNISLKWKSSSSSVVSVDENGKITGLKAGNATVTATTTDGSRKTASIDIAVIDEDATAAAFEDKGISLSMAGDVYIEDGWLQIYPGRSERVEILAESDKRVVKNADFKWKSDNTSVATVDAYGVVTAKAKGSAVITATGGEYVLTCDVDVSTDKVNVSSISFEKKYVSVIRKEPTQLKAVFNPKNATDQSLSWSSSNSNIATVDSNGVVTGKNTGICTIMAKVKNNTAIKATCEVEVVAKAVAIDYIDLGYETLEIQAGSYEILRADISPSNATDTKITWKSSNSAIVTVDKDGNISALKKGTATITATSVNDRSVNASCKITVYN